jgi:UDP-N-acetylmuramoylalanine--D-glutamate ligase
MDKIKKVAIFGMGKSGLAAVKLAKKLGLDIHAVNKGPVEAWLHAEGLDQVISPGEAYCEEDFAQHFPQMDEIILSPGIPLSHPALKAAIAAHVPIISEIEFAWRHSKDIPVIAVTGTNGKTTTTTMIAEVLKKAGKKVFCGGNIGIPYCELPLSEQKVDYAVIEVSSFQLETIKAFHPRIGFILNIFPNHSERYDEMIEYARAKFRLLNNMSDKDHVVLGLDNPFLNEIENHPVQKSFFKTGHLSEDFRSKFDFSQALVRGEHNEANFFCAYKVLELLAIEPRDELFQSFINEFPGVAHRLEYVLNYHGLILYNDAKSTNALATTTAIKAFKDSLAPLYLILGGKLRNEADTLLPDLLPYKNQITRIFTIGDVAQRLEKELGEHFKVTVSSDLKKVFQTLKAEGLKGNLVFSPAFPSFDQFKNYVHRGECCKLWAKEVFQD